MSAAPPRRHRYRTLLVLVLVFFAPLLLAFLVYYGSGWRPSARTNHGTLIEPPRSLPSIALTRLNAASAGTGAQSGAHVLTGKWSLVYIGAGVCDVACHQTLYFMRQTHLGLGNLSTRVQRVFLVTEPCCDREYLEREHPGLIMLDAQAGQASALLSQFPPDQPATTIFIVDPQGNLMMRYDANALPKGLLEDLKKLLALSHIG
jgi:cytochrome oxidase Cu insertion factor (SCO1/SenC/PrrC family)